MLAGAHEVGSAFHKILRLEYSEPEGVCVGGGEIFLNGDQVDNRFRGGVERAEALFIPVCMFPVQQVDVPFWLWGRGLVGPEQRVPVKAKLAEPVVGPVNIIEAVEPGGE